MRWMEGVPGAALSPVRESGPLMCQPSAPCGGAIVEDTEFRRITGRRMGRCFGGGHTLLVEAEPARPPGVEKRCRWCAQIIRRKRRKVYCNDRCCLQFKRRAEMATRAALRATKDAGGKR